MEIYTGDLITMAQQCAEKISSNIGYVGNVVEDECCNLQRDIRNKIHERLSEAFEKFIDDSDYFDSSEDFRNNLFKIINEL